MKDKDLRLLAGEIRIAAIETLGKFGSGHIGGSMSVVEALAVLYGGTLRHDPKNPNWEDRDWFIMSKGHAGPALYAALAIRGYFPRNWLDTLNEGGTNLPSHCDRTKTPGVDMTAGSLGQGLSGAAGLAIGNKLSGRDSYVYIIIGDGECDEGQIWEAAGFTAHHKLSNLIGFIDWNKQQLDGFTSEVMEKGSLESRFASFGFYTETVDGHNVTAIKDAIGRAKAQGERPSMIILDTIKGYGCTFAQGLRNNHSMPCTPEDVAEAVAAVRASMAAL